MTAHPTADWVVQQLRESFPGDRRIRFLVHDNDSIFSERLDQSIATFGVEAKPTSPGSPWQNGTAERRVETVKRDLLDHVIVIDESHLRRVLREYVEYYNEERVHTAIRGAPKGREITPKPCPAARDACGTNVENGQATSGG